MSRFKLYFFIFLLCFQFCLAEISDKRLCLDEKCSQAISTGKTLLPYSAPDLHQLSFRPNEHVTIYSKSAGSNEDLWGVEIGGRRGYIPKRLVREVKILTTVKPSVLVDTEFNVESKPQVPSIEENVRPSKVKESHEVIQGTTIYPEINDAVDVTSTEDSHEIVEEVTESNPSNVIDNKSEQTMETSTEPGSYLSGMFDTVLDMVNSTVNHINTLSDGDNEKKVEEVEPLKVEPVKDSTESKVLVEEIIEPQNFNSPLNDKAPAEEILEPENSNSPPNEKASVEEMVNTEEIIETKQFDNTSKDSIEEIVDSSDQNQVLNEHESAPNEDLLDSKPSEVTAEIQNTDSPQNVQEENLIPEIPIPDPNIISPDINIKENLGVENNNTETSTESSVNQEINESDNSESNAQVVPENLSPLPDTSELGSNKTEKVSNGDLEVGNVTENISKSNSDMSMPVNTTENEEIGSQSDSLNDIEKKPATGNAWSFVPKIPVVPIEPITSSSGNEIKAESSNTSNLQEETTTESLNISEIPLSTTQIPKNPLESLKDTVLPDENVNISEIIPDIIQEKSEEQPINAKEELVNDTVQKIETTFSDTTPAYSEYVTPFPPVVTEENTQKYDQVQKPEIYSDPVIENESSKNDYNYNELPSENIFSTPISDNIINEETVKDNVVVESENNHKEQITDGNVGLFSYLEKAEENMRNENHGAVPEISDNAFISHEQHCVGNDEHGYSIPMDLNVSSDIFMYLVTTAISVIIFLLGYFALDKSRREGPLVAKINKLEKEFLVILKEKEILSEQITNEHHSDPVETQDVINLQQEYYDVFKQKKALEEQVQTLEKELENSTEVGLELNRMLSELLNSENAGDTLMSNIEQLQAQLAEQQEIVSNMKETLSLKETENHELNLELDIANKKVVELQGELDKLLLSIMKVEEEKELQEKSSESEITSLKEKLDALRESLEKHQSDNFKLVDELKDKLSSSERSLQLKIKEYDGLKANMQKIKTVKNANTLESLLEVTSIKAELEQLKAECESHCKNLQKEKEKNSVLEKKSKCNEDEIDALTKRFDETDRARLELETKLQVLTTYFKDRETQLQKDLSKYESMWSAKQGEATSTSERIKYLQSEVQNYKSQNESLKEEIVSQEVELKSQISVLEKKVHENWVSARQAERRLEDLKQEAAQLRNRLTLRERALQEDKTHNRMQSPLEQNGEGPMAPLHLDTPSSPPLLYNSRDHITKSPAMMGMPPPFLPPPPGAPFLPPPHMPFMPPPPPDMFPGDHRPPPLGRMSSPPLNSRYSPDRRAYSPYDRRSPSPSYDESDFVSSPVHHRRFSPFSGMDHRRMPPPMGKINGRSGALSSGSGNSNESLDEINHSNSKV